MTDDTKERTKMTVGLDLGDKYTHFCLLDADSAQIVEEGRLRTTPDAFARRFGSEKPLRIAIEVGTHSPWVSRVLEECGHEVLVANPRKTRLIHAGARKSDKIDAEKLARLARLDPELLYPVDHRGEASQAHLALIRSREVLVRSRAKLINHVRGTVKPFGHRLPKCSTRSFHEKAPEHLPEEPKEALQGVVEIIASLTEKIEEADKKIEDLATRSYPETELVRQVPGVGALTALTFVLTLEEPERFAKSRSVGAYLGLVPGRDQSGDSDPQKRISKQGDEMLRRLLVGSAHYIMGPFGEDSDLRRHGEKLSAGGSKRAKKRAVVGVGRKLSALLHHLWSTGEVYDPLHNARRSEELRRQVVREEEVA